MVTASAGSKELIQQGLPVQIAVQFIPGKKEGRDQSSCRPYFTFTTFDCRPATKQNLGSHAAKICVPNIVDAVELGSDNATSTYFFAAVQKAGEKSDAVASPATVSSTAKARTCRLLIHGMDTSAIQQKFDDCSCCRDQAQSIIDTFSMPILHILGCKVVKVAKDLDQQ